MNQVLDHINPDHAIDKVLTGLRNTPTPNGLAARVNAHLLQAAESPTRSTLFASPLHLAWATAACATIVALTLLRSHIGENRVAQGFSLGSHRPLIESEGASAPDVTTRALQLTPATTRVAPRFSVGSHRASIKTEEVLTPDPDAIALAETLAPSHPAPPLPLTAQEALLLRSTRQGQPIEVAELETRRTSVLTQIAEARELATVREYIHGLLGPLAAAQILTPPPSPSDDTKPAAADSETPPSQ